MESSICFAEPTYFLRLQVRVSIRKPVRLSPMIRPRVARRLLSYSRILFAIAVLFLLQSKL